ncbi:MAG: HNH endonuclease, partial [Chloroflexi bacterium]|nr:HNH endonuclease [Chloroflexota bacterium]
MESCDVCQKTQELDRHHIVPRRMGGSKDPSVLGEDNLITVCRTCHRNIHEGGWVLERSPNLLRVVDGRSGDVIMRRHHDHDFDPAAFLDLLNRLDASLDQAVHLVRYLDDDQLVEAFRGARSLGKRAWLLEAAILYEAQR